MYKGIWKYDIMFHRGDIVYFCDNLYICNIAHMSSILTAPNKEDIYWIHIDFDIPGLVCNIEIEFGGSEEGEAEGEGEGTEEVDNSGYEGESEDESQGEDSDYIPESEGDDTEGGTVDLGEDSGSDAESFVFLQISPPNDPEEPPEEEQNENPPPPEEPQNPPRPKKTENTGIQTGDPSTLPKTFFILNDLINNVFPPRNGSGGSGDDNNPFTALMAPKLGPAPPPNPLKRKLIAIEEEVNEYNKKIKNKNIDVRDRLLLLNVDIETKAYILNKYDEQIAKMNGSDRAKGNAWINTICNLPFGNYRSFPVTKDDPVEEISGFFQEIRDKMDSAVYGHNQVKDEIMEFVAKCITNPNSKGQILALCGYKGTGKTKLIKKGLSEALGLPFFQINFGGMTDSNILMGHDMTYIGSKPGKLVEILTKAQCMNPIIYLDEVDKVSETKSREIFGVLTHLLDQEQNHEFYDNYLSGIKIDLSKALFVIAFNDINQVDHIVSDRMKVIDIGASSVDDKVEICTRVVIPEMCKEIGLEWVNKVEKDKVYPQMSVNISPEILRYIIKNKVKHEEGVRQLKRALETIFNKINIDILLQRFTFATKDNVTELNTKMVDQILVNFKQNFDNIPPFMYS